MCTATLVNRPQCRERNPFSTFPACLLRCLLALLLALPVVAGAQANIVVRPTASISPTPVLTTAVGPGLTTCLVLASDDFLDVAKHFDCFSAAEGTVTDHTITVIEGGGHVTVNAVTVRDEADGSTTVSNPSPNFKKVLDVPGRPVIES